MLYWLPNLYPKLNLEEQILNKLPKNSIFHWNKNQISKLLKIYQKSTPLVIPTESLTPCHSERSRGIPLAGRLSVYENTSLIVKPYSWKGFLYSVLNRNLGLQSEWHGVDLKWHILTGTKSSTLVQQSQNIHLTNPFSPALI